MREERALRKEWGLGLAFWRLASKLQGGVVLSQEETTWLHASRTHHPVYRAGRLTQEEKALDVPPRRTPPSVFGFPFFF